MISEIINNIPSILFYFTIFFAAAISVYFGLKYAPKKKVLGIALITLGILVPSVIAGIRSDVGGDYRSYYRMYDNVANGRSMYFRPIEPGSALIITIAGHLSSSPLMFFVFNLLTNICFFCAFLNVFSKDARKTSIAFIAYLAIMYPASLFVMRNMLAFGIATLGCSFPLKKASWKNIALFVILAGVAFFFHKTAILILTLLPSFIIARVITNKKRAFIARVIVLALYGIAAAIMPLVIRTMQTIVPIGDYSRYLSWLGNGFSIPLTDIVLFIPVVIALAFTLSQKSKACEDGVFLQTLYCSLFFVPLSIAVGWLTTLNTNALSRLSFLLEPLIICVIAHIVTNSLSLPRRQHSIISAIAIMIIGVISLRNLVWSVSLPYNSIINPPNAAQAPYSDGSRAIGGEEAPVLIESKGRISDAAKD